MIKLRLKEVTGLPHSQRANSDRARVQTKCHVPHSKCQAIPLNRMMSSSFPCPHPQPLKHQNFSYSLAASVHPSMCRVQFSQTLSLCSILFEREHDLSQFTYSVTTLTVVIHLNSPHLSFLRWPLPRFMCPCFQAVLH